MKTTKGKTYFCDNKKRRRGIVPGCMIHFFNTTGRCPKCHLKTKPKPEIGLRVSDEGGWKPYGNGRMRSNHI